MNITRRRAMFFTAAATAGGFSGISSAFADEGKVYDVDALMKPRGWVDRAILGSGQTGTGVTVIEYTSPTCPFCAAFHNETYPRFKADYIENDKLTFILRPFTRNVLDAVVFMLADAAGEDMYHNVIEAYFRSQEIWSRSQTPRRDLLAVAMELGFTEESFENALTNQEVFVALEQVRDQALDEFGLTGTPTFYINGKMLSGHQTIEEMAARVDPLLG